MFIKDEDFLRDRVPMTKFEVRSISIALLDINKGDKFVDIGAGTGSISIQAALLGADVVAIERDKEALELIRKNAEKFKVEIEIIHAKAEDVLNGLEFDKCFLGGSGNEMDYIVDIVDRKLRRGGIIVANFIKLSNANKFIENMSSKGYSVATSLVSVSRMDENGLLKANNPIFVVKAVKCLEVQS
ncbi:putative cobalt-precorrin-6Y C(15)-methyltransferase [decarboxylating] [Caloramator mitchellensis]|uniref:Putative cobalt-precorrin-6Y C(15)-methyltransferase [decarboxylating] n=1 Tax=Caloramator mitchellensis TaxID=908809 RepID=A0A0R3JYB2_CALMK|nr:precorrin-6Y C5,15-methyltransferase (decarboxylating) subunit CbiT [Caloramator mitchellensis]KRQ85916.1 putative cobalt-precorrin-6Y C(15)-methyltransferase [decarboxylating] [Caloramator mitchellensis]